MKWAHSFMAGAAVDIVTLDPISLMVNPLIYSQIKKETQYSYKSHSIKFGDLISGGVTEGFTFFNIPEYLNNLNGWKISVVLKDTETKNDIILDYALSGSIVSPKERSSAVE